MNMKLNKFVVTKTYERIFVLQMTEQEFEDLHSSLGMAIPVAMKIHKDSPSFKRSLHKLKRQFGVIWKDAMNREKQKLEGPMPQLNKESE